MSRALNDLRNSVRHTREVRVRHARGWSGGGRACPNAHFIQAHGEISGGTASLILELPDVVSGDGTGLVSQSFSMDWDITAAELQTLLEGHDEYSGSGLSCTLGPLPDREIHLIWTGDYSSVAPPTVNNSGLTKSTGAGFRSGSFKAVT